MACCGKGRANTDYEVTFGDGSKKVFSSMAEVRIAIAKYNAESPELVKRRASTYKPVPRTAS
jgi:hypothetical protein